MYATLSFLLVPSTLLIPRNRLEPTSLDEDNRGVQRLLQEVASVRLFCTLLANKLLGGLEEVSRLCH